MRCLLPFALTLALTLPCLAQEAEAEGAVAIMAQVKPSLVKITQVGREGIEGLGSGFVVSDDGLIATNMHVVGQGRRLQVELADGRKLKVQALHAFDYDMDLAVLRVQAEGLQPLALGDSDQLEQGQPIVAMGNPQGLEFSVVQGVISATRPIEGREMIQVAVPIERGNSGGPLLNREGEVLGVLTLKSQRSENLGFAEPINDLKKLLAKPNSIPMERWLTIGVPDPRQWKLTMGAQWTQHAGMISVEQAGDGFGGRAHCLSLTDVPELPYEVAVNVKLDDEAGAAGIVVCCDKANRCYGFYPTGGNLRLARFDGPMPTTWTIFDTVPNPAYRRGEFNHLRIRVEADALTCFVNGVEVIRQEDDAFRDGSFGLCKFRGTQADFKGFRVGPDLRDKPVPAEVASRVLDTVKGYLDQEHSRSEALDDMLNDRAAARRVLTERAQALEKEAAALRKLGLDLHRRTIARDLVKQLDQPEEKIDLLRAALMIAKHDNAEVDVPHYLRVVDRMASELRADPQIKKGGEAAVQRLNRYFFEENGFHGSRYDFDNAANSYVNEVLDNREGLPITLSLVFIEVARRLGLKDVVGMPLPGRFMVGYKGTEKAAPWRFNDVYEGGKLLSAEQAWEALDLPPEGIQPATKRMIIERMLHNLIGQMQDDNNLPKPEAVPYLTLLIDLDPTAVSYRFQRFTARSKANDFAGARDDLKAILDDPPEAMNEDQLRELQALYRRFDDRTKVREQ